MLVADYDFQLLPADTIRLRPERVVLLHDLGILDDSFQLLHHALMYVRLFADHRVVLVIRVVRVTQLAIGPELKFQKLVSELALVTDVVAYVKVCRHPGVYDLLASGYDALFQRDTFGLSMMSVITKHIRSVAFSITRPRDWLVETNMATERRCLIGYAILNPFLRLET